MFHIRQKFGTSLSSECERIQFGRSISASWLWLSPEDSARDLPVLGHLQSLLVERVAAERAETQGTLMLRQLRKTEKRSVSRMTSWQKRILATLTSAADTKESVEPMLTVSLQHESSKSSLAEPSGCCSKQKAK